MSFRNNLETSVAAWHMVLMKPSSKRFQSVVERKTIGELRLSDRIFMTWRRTHQAALMLSE
jgi:hypothetical protein